MSTSSRSSDESSSKQKAQYTLIVNVPFDTVRQDLLAEFKNFGNVELAMVVCDEVHRNPHKEWTSTAGYAFIRFNSKFEAFMAIKAANMGLITIRGVKVRANWAHKDSYKKRKKPLGTKKNIKKISDILKMNEASSPKKKLSLEITSFLEAELLRLLESDMIKELDDESKSEFEKSVASDDLNSCKFSSEKENSNLNFSRNIEDEGLESTDACSSVDFETNKNCNFEKLQYISYLSNIENESIEKLDNSASINKSNDYSQILLYQAIKDVFSEVEKKTNYG